MPSGEASSGMRSSGPMRVVYFSQAPSPYLTSSNACSRVCAMCIGATTRQRRRSATLPLRVASSSTIAQCEASPSRPGAVVALSDSMPEPRRPASFGPLAECCAVTASSKHGWLYGRCCRRASTSLNQSVSCVTVSPERRRTIVSMPSSIRGRMHIGSRSNIAMSVGSAPGPMPSMKRPRVRWSRRTARWAVMKGLWYGIDATPVPSMIRCVLAAA